jgi:hypothetical protein
VAKPSVVILRPAASFSRVARIL